MPPSPPFPSHLGDMITSGISVGEWLEAEESLKPQIPPGCVTVAQYAIMRNFGDTAIGKQKAYRILKNLVANKRAEAIPCKPTAYRLLKRESMSERVRRIIESPIDKS